MVITHVTNFGFFVHLSRSHVEGMVHVSNLIDDYYQFEQDLQCLVGEHSGIIFGIGDNLSVKIVSVYPDERKVNFEVISHDPIPRRVSMKRHFQTKPRRFRGKRK